MLAKLVCKSAILFLLTLNIAFAADIGNSSIVFGKPSQLHLADASLNNTKANFISPEKYGAVGDGITDDTNSLKAAFSAAGSLGVVLGDGTYKVTTLLGYAECERRGKGVLVYGDNRWNFSTDNSAKSIAPNQYSNNVSVASSDYNHFPNAAEYNGVIVVGMNHNKSHGQANNQAISLPQAVLSAGNLAINGRYASGGYVAVQAHSRVTITSTADDRSRTFTITGFKNGKPVSFKMSGANASTATSLSSKRIDKITSVSVDAACAGEISVGLNFLPGNVELRYSTDRAKSFSSPIVVGDGLTDGKNLYYASSLGVTNDGLFVIIYTKLPIVERGYATMRRASRDGRLWSNEALVTYNVKPTTTLGLYGEIKSTPSGKLLMATYSGSDNWVFVSNDNGLSWTGKLFAKGAAPSQGYNEVGIAVLDENNWILVSRIEYVVTALMQFKTTDGGTTFTKQGPINQPAGGGDVSPQLFTFYKNATQYVGLMWMVRKSVSHPAPNENHIVAVATTADSALISPSTWSKAVKVVSAFGKRSGYPSILYEKETGDCLVFYGDEVDEYTSNVKTTMFNISQLN
jgi:hypothetical protein